MSENCNEKMTISLGENINQREKVPITANIRKYRNIFISKSLAVGISNSIYAS
jgi:hypothetical protein